MARGGGRYDAEVVELREKLQALGIVLIVIEGNRGDGFSVVVAEGLERIIPDTLELAAASMRKDISQ